MDILEKVKKEKELVQCMVEIYCHSKHGKSKILCEDCNNLLAYAFKRIDSCPFMETKTFCSNCKVHCYSPVMRERIRQVMAFSGPRLLFVHPFAAISHLIHSKIRR
ncbi:MAG: nitrous oxide-stimulated promoter family protein [Anaerotignaceae bacterium]